MKSGVRRIFKENVSHFDQSEAKTVFKAQHLLTKFARLCRKYTEGRGVLHSKGTWGCAAHKSILFRTSSLAKGILFGNFSRV